MFTPHDSYFLYQAERPRTRGEQLAEDVLAAELIAGLERGRGLLAWLGRHLRAR